jgi:uroporphyrinogen-III synthase
MNGALSGVGVLVTRPRPQALLLAKTLREAGADPVVFPGVELEPVEGPRLAAALRETLDADLIVFVSPNAARFGMALLTAAGAMPSRAKFAAVGPGTARELTELGAREVIVPRDGYDSEALARHPALQAVRGSKIVIFRGRGGREHLAAMLRERGAQVVLAECYRRSPPRAQFAATLADWRSGRIAAWTASSVEIVDNLFALAGADGSEWLRRKVVFVPHARIAAAAFAHGARTIVVTGAGDAGLLSALETWFGNLRRVQAQQTK